ncbi:domain of Kin17 curved DNA-binding protein-domain-containing protein [Lentinula edodes]|uniref:domain of Kin17 curved DNA-binding protein-domain-containing protein n=1 Tax=Lentinula edodes TaxID=5353 RepID=UPI001E8D5A31|nr:domain of Kin17 curved DNA-binding protein-domain-containing protein [Lentinula edodes]KAH7874602.1 domain of Kin17 curved DNA-binding protein-domain-containing protein [Lentinula edodes]
MPRAEVGTPKYVANKMKSKGLQRLRWYCQVCEKQCRDENGFKCHAASESHLRQMLVVGEHAGKHISNFSQEFQSTFVALLSRRFGTKRVRANQVYQEYIADKHHLHMNSTRWVTLTEFIKHLGRTGVARVDETEKGWFIAWIDNSPKALAKAEASMKKERATTSDEQRERTLIAEQIERAAAEAGPSRSETPPEDLGLKRDEGAEKVVLSLSAKAADAPNSFSPPAPLKMNAFKSSAFNPLKPATNPLKRPNVFKSTTASSSSSTGTSIEKDAKKRALPMSAAERLIVEEQERKRRRMDKESMN